MKKHFVSVLFFCLLVGNAFSQISSPGEGKAHTADWFAFGIRQELDTIEGKGWQSMSYIGLGRKSNPDNYDPFYKPAILVLNQEFYHQFHNDWQYSFALSYRRQDEYLDNSPYEHDIPKLKQEFRLYSRVSYPPLPQASTLVVYLSCPQLSLGTVIKNNIANIMQDNIQWSKELSIIAGIISKMPLEKSIKWGAEVFTFNNKNVVSYGGFKNYFAIWFYNGVFLKDSYNVLINAQEGKTKSLRQWRFKDINEIDEKK